MSDHLDRLRRARREFDEDRLARLLAQHGSPADGSVEEAPEGWEGLADPSEQYFLYRGPLDERTRPFCSAILGLDRYWTLNDIDTVSRKVGYDVFGFCGSFSCRHQWVRARIKGRIQEGFDPSTPTRGQIDRAAVKQDSRAQDYFPLPPSLQ